MNNEEKKIEVMHSKGYGKNGKMYAYIHPGVRVRCFNRSRRVGGYTRDELSEAINRCIEKWFTPLVEYEICGQIIYSNCEKNALKEFWRVC